MGGVEEQHRKNDRSSNRRHGSTGFFLMVDYLFLFVFFCFLCYFLLQMWPGSALPPTF